MIVAKVHSWRCAGEMLGVVAGMKSVEKRLCAWVRAGRWAFALEV